MDVLPPPDGDEMMTIEPGRFACMYDFSPALLDILDQFAEFFDFFLQGNGQ